MNSKCIAMVRPFQFTLLILLGLAMAAPAHAENKKHHLGLILGYEKLLSDDLKDDASGIDFTDAVYGALAYRFSIQRNIDLTLDWRSTVSTQTSGGIDFTLSNSFLGPGIRLISPNEGMRPYVQANFFYVGEDIQA
ncbi:MAG TPA: hypothetical protein VK527_06705, partial [Candidatus Limnocylindrales bacterium]|nr:hypothetical protein [Candidatus Limnocylindrales bacterium]